ncbi:glycosyltransferase family 32 protein [Anaerovibrio lipolyticus]|uniref:glycosyltransferase family 32 protein n=1 Tax=Anaerovibrio lipolyticus TaxID=82374 RepID=UPI0009DED03E|nr:glycosyltransferase [Anaerovibrio lipolyticus]
MIIRNGTFTEFIASVGSKKLFVYGAGQNAHEFFSKYQRELLDINICAVIDNNISKQNKNVNISGRIFSLISERRFTSLGLDQSEIVILLTMGNFWDVLESLDSASTLADVACYIYPLIRLEELDKGIYEVAMPPNSLREKGEFVIPPIIHYCWFGRTELSPIAKKCIESWQRFCPGFKIRLWNENNYDVTKNHYMLSAYKEKKWAYVSDYARVDVVNQYGGVYLDTDVEILRPLDMLMREKAFAGFENEEYVNFGQGFGSVANNPVLLDLLDLYSTLPWDGGQIRCPEYQTKILEKHGLIRRNSFQKLDNMTILPVRYLCPISSNSGRKHNDLDSFAIHHYAASWVDENIRKWMELKKKAVYDVG